MIVIKNNRSLWRSTLLRFCPGFSDRPFHVFVALFVHLLHHVHQTCTKVFIFLLFLRLFKSWFLLQQSTPISSGALFQSQSESILLQCNSAVLGIYVFTQISESKAIILFIYIKNLGVHWLFLKLKLDLFLIVCDKAFESLHWSYVHLDLALSLFSCMVLYWNELTALLGLLDLRLLLLF